MEPDKNFEVEQEVVSEEKTQSLWTTVTPFSKYFALVIFIVLPFVGAWIGYTYLPEKVVEVEIEQVNIPSSEEKIMTEAETTVSLEYELGYRGKPIEMIETDVNPNLYKTTDASSRNRQFWASRYFIADNNVHYAHPSTNVTTSSILTSVDASSFYLLGRNVYDPFDYARDKEGIICDNLRANHIDPVSFRIILDENKRATKFAMDKEHVFYDCMILPGARPETFQVMDDVYGEYGFDNNYVFYKADRISDKPDSFAILDDGYSYDEDTVYLASTSVGSISQKVPNGFSGTLQVLQDTVTRSIGYLLLTHDDGKVELLTNPVIDTAWINYGYLVPDKEGVYFLDTNNKISYLSLQTGLVTDFDLEITSRADRYASEWQRSDLNYLFSYNDSLYYLVGPNCNEYLGQCDLALYFYETSAGLERLLTTGVKTREIAGYDTENQELHLEYRGGDGGCGWASHETYNLVTGLLTQIGSESTCIVGIDEETNEEILDKDIPPEVAEHKLRRPLLEGSGLVGVIVVRDGLVVSE